MWEENCGTAGNHSGRRAEVTCAALQWVPHRHLVRSNTRAVPELLRWQREPSATSYNHTAQAFGQPNMKPAASLRHYGLSSSEIPETADEDDSIKTEPHTTAAARVSTEQGQWEPYTQLRRFGNTTLINPKCSRTEVIQSHVPLQW